MKIADYALIGDGHSAALVGKNGSIDWLCLPAFDNEAFLARLLGNEENGYCQLKPRDKYSSQREYVKSTNILVTQFATSTGKARLTDFMVINSEDSEAKTHFTCLLRQLTVEEGQMDIDFSFFPRANYGAEVAAKVEKFAGGFSFHWPEQSLEVLFDQTANERKGGLEWTGCLKRGENLTFALFYGADPTLRDSRAQILKSAFEKTKSYWETWSSNFSYDGPYKEQVQRSALVLKALAHRPHGSIVAAPTTSLPEVAGGESNWDYRYSWLRDSVFCIEALSQIGHEAEAQDFFKWLMKATNHCALPISIAYTIAGDPVPKESELKHLQGYMNSQPVHLGNAAGTQFQLDVYGELIRCFAIYMEEDSSSFDLRQANLRSLLDWLADNCDRPDQGIWELRGPPKNYVYSKAMAWVALKNGQEALQALSKDSQANPKWQKAMTKLRADIFSKGIHPTEGYFTEAYEIDSLDAGNLRLSLVEFVDVDHPAMQKTIEHTMKRLHRQGLVYRREKEEKDPQENAFLLCSFWLVQNLALAGRTKEATTLFETLLDYANDVGLMSEEADPETKELFGNFPQAFTHLGLINAAKALLGQRPENLRPPSRRIEGQD